MRTSIHISFHVEAMSAYVCASVHPGTRFICMHHMRCHSHRGSYLCVHTNTKTLQSAGGAVNAYQHSVDDDLCRRGTCESGVSKGESQEFVRHSICMVNSFSSFMCALGMNCTDSLLAYRRVPAVSCTFSGSVIQEK